MWMKSLEIKMVDSSDTETMNHLVADLKAAASDKNTSVKIYAKDSPESEEQSELLKHLVNLVFSVLIAILMFLCFFSLSTSMSANLHE